MHTIITIVRTLQKGFLSLIKYFRGRKGKGGGGGGEKWEYFQLLD